MSNSFKILLLVIAGGVCVVFLVTLPSQTLRSRAAKARYLKNPSPQALSIAETTEREDRRNMMVLRGLFALALGLDVLVLMRLMTRNKKKEDLPTTT